ncbi:MAG: DUF58 domain-containing protein [Pseudomonadota bacterium]
MNLIPTSRLLFLFAVICIPFTILASVISSATILSYAIIIVFVLAAVVDAIFSVRLFDGIRIECNELVRMSVGRSSAIKIIIKNDAAQNGPIRLGLLFPDQLFSENQDIFFNLSSKEINSALTWPVKGLKKGQYLLNKCYLEKKSLAGLWAKRTTFPIYCEIRVYPDLFSENKLLAALSADRSMGAHARRQIGKGREFEKLRDYNPGDSYEDIHWKATAKRSLPVTKVFQVERTQDIYVMIDASRMSARNAHIFNNGLLGKERRSADNNSSIFPQETILDRYITAGLMIGKTAEKHGDNYGIVLFSDRVSLFIKAKSGKAHYNVCRDSLYNADPNRVTPDFRELFTFAGTRIRKRALMIILTSLDDPVMAEDFIKHIHILSRYHLIMANMIKPAAANSIFSSSDIMSINSIYQDLGGHIVWNRLRELNVSLTRHGADFFLLESRRLCSQLISNYIDIKQRQIL